MLVNFDLYHVFFTVAYEKNFSRAAKKLFVTQSSVSQSIKKLEKLLDLQLFFRQSRGVALTDAGRILYRYISRSYGLVIKAERVLENIRELKTGEICIGASDSMCSYFLLPFIKSFHENYPNVKIHITNRTSLETLNLLKKGLVDIGFVNLPVSAKGINVIQTRIVHDGFIASEKFKKLKHKKIPFKQLKKFPLLMLEKKSNSRKYVDRFFEEQGIILNPEIELGSFDLLVEFANIGMGIACIIKEFVRDKILKPGNLFEIEFIHPIPGRYLGIITLKNMPLSSAANSFLNMIIHQEKTGS